MTIGRNGSLAISALVAATMMLLGSVDKAAFAQRPPEFPDVVRIVERHMLTAFYHATNGPEWTNNANWLTDAPVGVWHGVVTDGNGRVTGLRLIRNGLSGEIPPVLGYLANLTELRLNRNRLIGEIPPELGYLANLTSLRLTWNQLSGRIPPTLGDLADLTDLRLAGNQLSGPIPPELGGLPNLTTLLLSHNQLSGPIPPELGGLPNLTSLLLSHNQLSGPIPPELGDLPNLTSLLLSHNQLSGPIPPELGGLPSLTSLRLDRNLLSGEIAPELANLPNLTELLLGANQLSGEIPPELGDLPNLISLRLDRNQLSGEIPPELADLNLTVLRLHSNHLSGEIPPELGYLANLRYLWLGRNHLSGEIPPELGYLANLTELWLDENQLSGEIPPALGQLPNLTELALKHNRLNGEIPPELGYLANLTELWLNDNRLNGEIPPELGDLANLTVLSLSGNRLTGEIPPELGYLANLTRLSLSNNWLNGEIPAALGDLSNLLSLQLNHNHLSGEIPRTLGYLANLTELRLDANRLTGEIPPELDRLPNLTALSLGANPLSGEIPARPAPIRVAPPGGIPGVSGKPVEVVLTEAFAGRKFERPTEVGAYPVGPDGDAGIFIAEQEGRILLMNPESGESAELLDIRDRVSTMGDQDGLLSVALDPRFERTGHLWVCYVAQDPQLVARLSRFWADPGDPRRVDPGSELPVLEVPQPYLSHGCGSIRFGSDGMLYLGLGDGEVGGDWRGHGQNPGTLLGSVIRIDASGASAGAPYAVPPDNPFVDVPGVRPEIFAYGFRNPWRMAFDPATGALWLGDVGEGELEEIDRIEAGGNFGWNRLEGTRCHNPPEGCNPEGTVPPVVTYSHAVGCAVTGGVVYRGETIPALAGHYLFSDFCRRQIWALPLDGGDVVEIAVSPRPVSSFGTDTDGEVYLLTFGGSVLRIAASAP